MNRARPPSAARASPRGRLALACGAVALAVTAAMLVQAANLAALTADDETGCGCASTCSCRAVDAGRACTCSTPLVGLSAHCGCRGGQGGADDGVPSLLSATLTSSPTVTRHDEPSPLVETPEPRVGPMVPHSPELPP